MCLLGKKRCNDVVNLEPLGQIMSMVRAKFATRESGHRI